MLGADECTRAQKIAVLDKFHEISSAGDVHAEKDAVEWAQQYLQWESFDTQALDSWIKQEDRIRRAQEGGKDHQEQQNVFTSSVTTTSSSSTEKEKMMAGDLYQAFDPELLRDRNRAKQICFDLNQTSPLDISKRTELTQKLLGRTDAHIESPFYCDYGYNLRVGKNFYANHGCTILDCNLISIGDSCLLAPHVVLSAATHPLDAALRASGAELTAPIVIGNNCWIGASATINPGVTLGDNVVVGAGSVVTKRFPDNVVIAGVPAKIIRRLDTAAVHGGTP